MNVLSRFTRLLPALCLLAFGCDYDDDHEHHHYGYDRSPEPQPAAVVRAGIDTDQKMAEVDYGAETGLMVEYTAGGRWHLYTTCDYDVTGVACIWDVWVTPQSGGVISLSGEGVEPEDFVSADTAYTYGYLQAITTRDSDGIWLEAVPGAPLQLEVHLDGSPAPEFIRWVDGGFVNPGAPTNPLELTPSAP